MTISELPPQTEILDALWFAVLPAAGAAFVVFGLGVLVTWLIGGRMRNWDWDRAVPSVAVLALAAGVALSPLLYAGMREKVDTAKLVGDTETATRLTDTYHFRLPFPWVPDGKWWHWGWYAIGLALAVEFLARWPGVRVGIGHLLRGAAAGVIASAVVPPDWQAAETRWWVPLAAFGMAIQWAIVDAVGRRNPGGGIAAAMAVVSLGAATVFIHDAAAGFTDLATFLFAALTVLTLMAWITGTDVGAAAAATVIPLLSLLLMNYDLRSEPKVPKACYWLVGLAPFVLTLFLFPPIARFSRWRLVTPFKILWVAIPVGIAVYRCLTEAPLKFGENW
jgi:hypothetical protein